MMNVRLFKFAKSKRLFKAIITLITLGVSISILIQQYLENQLGLSTLFILPLVFVGVLLAYGFWAESEPFLNQIPVSNEKPLQKAVLVKWLAVGVVIGLMLLLFNPDNEAIVVRYLHVKPQKLEDFGIMVLGALFHVKTHNTAIFIANKHSYDKHAAGNSGRYDVNHYYSIILNPATGEFECVLKPAYQGMTVPPCQLPEPQSDPKTH